MKATTQLLPLSGPASLATAGSGDVLAGILAGTLATMRDRKSTRLNSSHRT